MGRHLEFEPGEALQKAMLVFWRLGYERSSIQALETATGIGRKSLYRAFTDKHDLFLKSLGAYRAMMAEENLAPVMAPDAGIETIEALFDKLTVFARTEIAAMGCLICNTAMERGAGSIGQSTDLRQLARQGPVIRLVNMILFEALRRFAGGRS